MFPTRSIGLSSIRGRARVSPASQPPSLPLPLPSSPSCLGFAVVGGIDQRRSLRQWQHQRQCVDPRLSRRFTAAVSAPIIIAPVAPAPGRSSNKFKFRAPLPHRSASAAIPPPPHLQTRRTSCSSLTMPVGTVLVTGYGPLFLPLSRSLSPSLPCSSQPDLCALIASSTVMR